MSHNGLPADRVTVAVKISTYNSRGGSPRRGWLVYSVDLNTENSTWLAFIDEGRGVADLREQFPRAIVICTVEVPVSEYNSAKAMTA
jgi:hypothetical protein